ncbi:MAG: T9SS type A sorting domain-containing protein [Ignavibacteriaceae bacterium]|nr:T9SS type A sorting domain-containing protein [Ignavibacteriaceae bacterium]
MKQLNILLLILIAAISEPLAKEVTIITTRSRDKLILKEGESYSGLNLGMRMNKAGQPEFYEEEEDPEGTADVNGRIYAIGRIFGNIYIGGDFTQVNGISANRAAYWNGIKWTAMQEGLNGAVYTIYGKFNKIYVGGDFSRAGSRQANNIATWDATGWGVLGNGLNSVVFSITEYRDTIYAGGMFTKSGTTEVRRIAKWTGTVWVEPLYGTDGVVYALASDDSLLYVGGSFSLAGSTTPDSIHTRNAVIWTGKKWRYMGGGVNGRINTLINAGGRIIAGGEFDTAGSVAAQNIAFYNSGSWSAMGEGLNAEVNCLTIFQNDIVAGGRFTASGSRQTRYLARWNGSMWEEALGGMNERVDAIFTMEAVLAAGGEFTTAGNTPANKFAIWNGSEWEAPWGIKTKVINVLRQAGNEIYIGGKFTNINGVEAKNIARWNPAEGFRALGAGIEGEVKAIAVKDGVVYAGGDIRVAGVNTSVSGIARWDGTDWSSPGGGAQGLYPVVNAVEFLGEDLYAGGWFSMMGDTSAKNIARWDGEKWHPVGKGLSADVFTLRSDGERLLAGGEFNYTGDGAVMLGKIAVWDTLQKKWGALGTAGLPAADNTVYSVEVSGDSVTVAGRFSTCRGVRSPGVILYVKSQNRWVSLTDSLQGYGLCAAIGSTGEIVAGGEIMSVNGAEAKYIMRRANGTWEVSGGVNSRVHAVINYNGNIIAGGRFGSSAALPASGLAIWDGTKFINFNGVLSTEERDRWGVSGEESYELLNNYPNPFNPETVIRFSIPERVFVRGTVFSSTGERVAVLQEGEMEPGSHSLNFNGRGLSSGVYIFRLEAGGYSKTIKMMLLQ